MKKINNEKCEALIQVSAILSSAVDMQGTDGNWNYDEYHLGYLNGIIFSKHVVDNEIELRRNDNAVHLKGPKFKDTPEKFLAARAEEDFREKYPALKEAWGHYQLILALVKKGKSI